MATSSVLPTLTERNRANLFPCLAPESPSLVLWVSLRRHLTDARYAFLSPILRRKLMPYGRFRQMGWTFTRCFPDGIRLGVSGVANGRQTANISCSSPRAKSGPSARQEVFF